MTWIPKPEATRCELPAPFAPAREMTDDEFAAAEAEYDAQFSEDQRGAMRRFYEHTGATKRKAAARSAGSED